MRMIWLTKVKANPVEQTTQALADAYSGLIPVPYFSLRRSQYLENLTRVWTLAVVRR
jgi:hypothetical protein